MNLEARQKLNRQQRSILSSHQNVLAEININMNQLMKEIRKKIWEGKQLKKTFDGQITSFNELIESQTFAIRMVQITQAIFGMPVRLFGELPNDLSECLEWFNKTRSIVSNITLMEREVTKRIMECDKESIRSDRLYISLKTNQLQNSYGSY